MPRTFFVVPVEFVVEADTAAASEQVLKDHLQLHGIRECHSIGHVRELGEHEPLGMFPFTTGVVLTPKVPMEFVEPHFEGSRFEGIDDPPIPVS